MYIDFDGYWFGFVRVKFEIKKFDGSKDIILLLVYFFWFVKILEFEFSGDGYLLFWVWLILWGRKFVNVIGIMLMYYNGVMLDSKEEVDS